MEHSKLEKCREPLYKLEQFKVPLLKKNDIHNVIENIVGCKVYNVNVERLALDYRKKGDAHYVCNATYSLENKPDKEPINTRTLLKKYKRNSFLSDTVSVIGAGPAGLWAAYSLLLKGYRVNLYEQGKCVEERFRDIRRFLKANIFLEHSNVFFGEGGAGAFSDGKLNTRSRTEFSQAVLNDLISFGANKEVAYLSKPHIGTDKLQFLLKKIRQQILELGGKIYFEHSLQDISVKNNALNSICINNKWQSCEALVLATGHSARHIYKMLFENGVLLEGKSFAVGVRIEHLQSFINESRLGKGVDYKLTGAADYTLNSDNIYSFCMCPGGVVVPCASEADGIVTNGMSYSLRNSPFANSALVMPYNVNKDDVKGGIAFQRELEQKAFEIAGKNFLAPAQTVANFLAKKTDKTLPKYSSPHKLASSNLWDFMPHNICLGLETALQKFEKKMQGFTKNALLIAPETRTSSPIRIVRGNNYESVSTKGIYSIGEGAGYAGGILTSAADGIKIAIEP